MDSYGKNKDRKKYIPKLYEKIDNDKFILDSFGGINGVFYIKYNSGFNSNNIILKEPPKLSLSYGNKTIEALRKINSWTYKEQNGKKCDNQ